MSHVAGCRLSIMGDFNADEITARSGVVPTSRTQKGELIRPGLPYMLSVWEVESFVPHEKNQGMNNLILLLVSLRKAIPVLSSYCEKFNAGVEVFIDGSEDFLVIPNLIQDLASLKIYLLVQKLKVG